MEQYQRTWARTKDDKDNWIEKEKKVTRRTETKEDNKENNKGYVRLERKRSKKINMNETKRKSKMCCNSNAIQNAN